MRPTDKSRQTVVLYSPFCIIKNTDPWHGNFVVGSFHTRATKWIIRLRPSLCTVAPSPTDTLFRFFPEGRGRLYTGYNSRFFRQAILILAEVLYNIEILEMSVGAFAFSRWSQETLFVRWTVININLHSRYISYHWTVSIINCWKKRKLLSSEKHCDF